MQPPVAPADWAAGGPRARAPLLTPRPAPKAVPAPPALESHYKTAVKKTVVSILAATVFGAGTWVIKGKESGMEFYAAYVVEQSLSVDNLFVFLMLFEYFAVPLEYQGRVLTWGIIGALAMRGIMIVAGVAVVKSFSWVIVLFACILLVSAWKIFTENEEDHDLAHNSVVRLAKRLVGAVDEYDGDKFFTCPEDTLLGGSTGSGGSGGGGGWLRRRRVATPLLLCLVCIELSDFVFAVDSIPAVLGVSQDPFVVYTSNIFAIMALRSLYTLIARAAQQLPFLKPGVAIVLFFVGAKMLMEFFFHVSVGTGLSLAVVLVILGGSVVLSLAQKGGHWMFLTRKRKNSDSDLADGARDIIV